MFYWYHENEPWVVIMIFFEFNELYKKKNAFIELNVYAACFLKLYFSLIDNI